MQLLFVYNANSGKAHAVLDSMHKILSPSTYDCRLCELTFGAFTERKIWKQFRENSDVDMRFLHKDEFNKEFRSKWLQKYNFPVVLIENENKLELFITSEELESLNSPQALIKLIQDRLPLY